MKISLLSLLAILTLSVSSARADFIVTLLQVGPNVVGTGSGAINLNGLTFFTSATSNAGMQGNMAHLGVGTSGMPLSGYQSMNGPGSFGSGGGFIGASTASGDAVAIAFGLQLYVPQGYISNTALSSSATWNNSTFASLGVTPGTYVWSWGTGANQTFTLQIGGQTVPDSGSSMALLFLSLGALFAASRFRSPCLN